jgi:hypothetical protein
MAMNHNPGPISSDMQLLELHKKVDDMRSKLNDIVKFVTSLPLSQPLQLGPIDLNQRFLAIEKRIEAIEKRSPGPRDNEPVKNGETTLRASFRRFSRARAFRINFRASNQA